MMRSKVAGAQRWVVKIGSALLTADGKGLDRAAMSVWVEQMVALHEAGVELVLVSSGAVAAGMSRLGWTARPSAMHELQAAAAIGQMGLVQAWESSFAEHGLHTAQILLTHDDLSDRKRYLNARSTLRALVELKAIPVINENDTVVTDEIRFGDNDTLAALVANLVEADLLVILTDRDGMFDADPRNNPDAKLIYEARADDPALDAVAGSVGGALGRGGMQTKLRAARLAARSGAHTIIVGGRLERVLDRLKAGERIGTLLSPERGMLAALRRQQRTDALTGLEAVEHALQAPADDDGVRAGARSQARRTQLGLHAATAQGPTDAASHGVQRRVIGAGFVDQFGMGVVARVGVEHTVAVGEDHQQVGFHQVGHQGSQGVVVAETDFVGDHRVVLVDHRDRLELHQRAQRTAGVEVALAVGQVVVGQQDLRRVKAVLGEAGFPGLHQAHLADGGSSLQFVHRAGARGPAEAAHPGGNRSGRDQHQLDTGLMQGHHLLDPHAHGCAIQPLAICRQQRTSDLYDPALRTCHFAPHHLQPWLEGWTRPSAAHNVIRDYIRDTGIPRYQNAARVSGA